MSQQIYINGAYFSRDDAKISVYDHGLLYGDGVFEGMRIYSGKVFRLNEHLVRLSESGRAIGLANADGTRSDDICRKRDGRQERPVRRIHSHDCDTWKLVRLDWIRTNAAIRK